MVPSVLQTTEISQLQAGRTGFSGASCGEDRRLPQLQIVEKIVAIRQFLDKVVACPLVCNNRCLS